MIGPEDLWQVFHRDRLRKKAEHTPLAGHYADHAACRVGPPIAQFVQLLPLSDQAPLILAGSVGHKNGVQPGLRSAREERMPWQPPLTQGLAITLGNAPLLGLLNYKGRLHGNQAGERLVQYAAKGLPHRNPLF